MEELNLFFITYGWQLTLIALVGIVILGILKYADAFKKVAKENRKPIYLGISVGFSLIATIVYLLIIDQFAIEFFVTVAITIYALNQTMYSIYEQTKLRDLLEKVFNFIVEKFKKK